MDQLHVSVHLLLRGRIVQFETCIVRCVKEYEPNAAEILLVTSCHVNLREWEVWQEIARNYSLQIAVWDIERQQGISSKWAQKQSPHKIVIFTFSQIQEAQFVSPLDLAKFLLGDGWDSVPFLRCPYEAIIRDTCEYPAVLFLNAESSRIATALVSTSQEVFHYDTQFKSFNVSFGSVSDEDKKRYCTEAMNTASQLANDLEKKDQNYLYSTLYIDLPPESE
eukprot:CAMPEP_0117084092 /NCGR_PEP_ID=MMETSP0472-20121206/59190_1 /TAXON_ID=693140 ORGANISM="Tiarina fusus, Strain LIS" /NCGR_SAMPLE_ID=MMETSP0472 /ASSEMBLY_ACC=CAM_ASM_000603 /LENGTH=221 /DNA_ID=CAMNT_0004812951 /DNA_START=736 /DNA_END=1398 /DNA_ORIENTATION=+